MSEEPVRYKGIVIDFGPEGLGAEEAEEVQRFLLRGDRPPELRGRIKQAVLSQTNDKDEIIRNRVESEISQKLLLFAFGKWEDEGS